MRSRSGRCAPSPLCGALPIAFAQRVLWTQRALCAIAFMRGFAQCPKGTLRERVSLAAPDDSAGAVRHRLLSSSVAQTLRVPSPGGSALSAGLTAVGAWTIAPEGTEKSAIAKRALCAIAFMRGFAQCPKGTLRERVSLAAPKDSAGALRDRHHLWSVFFSFSASSVVLYG